MKIFDYQSGRELTDVSVILSEDELKDLAAYVQKLDQDPRVCRFFLTDMCGTAVRSELTLAIEQRLDNAQAS